MSDLSAMNCSRNDRSDEGVNYHMLATLRPDQLDAGVRDTLATLAVNFETLAAELREVIAAATSFSVPDVPVQMLAEAEGKLACGVRCLARSAGLAEAD